MAHILFKKNKNDKKAPQFFLKKSLPSLSKLPQRIEKKHCGGIFWCAEEKKRKKKDSNGKKFSANDKGAGRGRRCAARACAYKKREITTSFSYGKKSSEGTWRKFLLPREFSFISLRSKEKDEKYNKKKGGYGG